MVTNLTNINEDAGSNPRLAQGVKYPGLPGTVVRSKMQLRYSLAVAVAVAQASSYTSHSTPGLRRTSIGRGYGPKKTKKEKRKKKNPTWLLNSISEDVGSGFMAPNFGICCGCSSYQH